jgi:hypothetical protein
MLGPCFTAPTIARADCRHLPEHRYTWFARDDAAPDGRVLVQVCMASDLVQIGEWKTAAPAKVKRRRAKDDDRA